MGAIKLKREAFWTRLSWGSPETVERYRVAKRAVAWGVAKTKTWAWVELGKAMEKDLAWPQGCSGKPFSGPDRESRACPKLCMSLVGNY